MGDRKQPIPVPPEPGRQAEAHKGVRPTAPAQFRPAPPPAPPGLPSSTFFQRAVDDLELALFPVEHRAHEDAEIFTVQGRLRAASVLRTLDRSAFDLGFNAAVLALTKGQRGVNLQHPDYLRDRDAAYRKARS
jgi:hypothetical protein